MKSNCSTINNNGRMSTNNASKDANANSNASGYRYRAFHSTKFAAYKDYHATDVEKLRKQKQQGDKTLHLVDVREPYVADLLVCLIFLFHLCVSCVCLFICDMACLSDELLQIRISGSDVVNVPLSKIREELARVGSIDKLKLEQLLPKQLHDKDANLVVFCKAGIRSAEFSKILE